MNRDELVSALKSDWQTVEHLMQETGWQRHSLRGALSTLSKKHGLKVERRRIDGVTSYRISEAA